MMGTRYACAIPDLESDSVFFTGGVNTKQVVSRYDILGFVNDLPEMIEGRSSHGCASYRRQDGTQVRTDCVTPAIQ